MAPSNGKANGASKRGASTRTVVGTTRTKEGDLKTDYTRWRLDNDRGCHIWQYIESDEELEKRPQHTAEKYFLGLDTVSPPDATP